SSNGKNFVVYFGREFVELPFDINLQKFTKYDYPGTTTAMSYESVVTIGKAGVTKLISMNEPLKQAGFTVYQASYVMNPGEPPMSVFSVNQDPGRLPKYIGSLILAIGIIVFTFMRSSVYRNLKKG
ncbi:MAG: cytochrome c biogenesis protein ResB, partial [Pseudobdellovibrio sp.]